MNKVSISLPMSEDRVLEILNDIFNERPDQVAIALQILKEGRGLDEYAITRGSQ